MPDNRSLRAKLIKKIHTSKKRRHVPYPLKIDQQNTLQDVLQQLNLETRKEIEQLRNRQNG